MLIALATLYIFFFGGGGLEFYLANIEDPVKAHEMHEEIEALLAQGIELEELATAIDDLREELANCPPSLTPTP